MGCKLSSLQKIKFLNKDKTDLLLSLADKIEESVLQDKSICVCINNSSISCKNKIKIEEYEINNECLCFNDGNFEVDVCLDDKTKIMYSEDLLKCFTIKKDDMEMNVCFI